MANQTNTSQSPLRGLVLSGGGARGAYQAGVLSAIAEITKDLGIKDPFHIFTGASAGSINASMLACEAQDFNLGCQKLVDLWSHISSEQVFKTDALSLGKIGFRWIEDLSLGGLTGATPGKSLLDTSPLRKLLEKNLNFDQLATNIESGRVRALGMTALDYKRTKSVTFVQSADDVPMWNMSLRNSEKQIINAGHIMASAAIPLLFPAQTVGHDWYGDGCVGNSSPCGPAIYMGSDKIMAIGVRMNTLTAHEARGLQDPKAPSVARVVNVLLNAVMMDGIELDIERIGRINKFIDHVPDKQQRKISYRKIDPLWISPSADIGEIASQKAESLPRMVRYLIKGLGSLEDASEIISYLLFEPSFTTQLIEIGFEDGMQEKEAIKKFFTE